MNESLGRSILVMALFTIIKLYCESRHGDLFIGDIPHEAPGWYGVYNSDETTIQLMTDGLYKNKQ